MQRTLIAVALLVSCAGVAAQNKPQVAKSSGAPALEAKVRKVWEDFKNKDKESLAASLAEGFREFEEGGGSFGDIKAELAMVDEFTITAYTLKDFTVKSLGPNSALVTYFAHYEGKDGAEAVNANSVYGEVWVRQGNDWKALYIQETTVK